MSYYRPFHLRRAVEFNVLALATGIFLFGFMPTMNSRGEILERIEWGGGATTASNAPGYVAVISLGVTVQAGPGTNGSNETVEVGFHHAQAIVVTAEQSGVVVR